MHISVSLDTFLEGNRLPPLFEDDRCVGEPIRSSKKLGRRGSLLTRTASAGYRESTVPGMLEWEYSLEEQ